MGKDSVTAAARALRLLDSPDLRHHPATGPTERRSPSTTPGAPLNLGLVDYLDKTAGEVIALTREIAPDAGAAPSRLADLYGWSENATGDADEAQQAYRDLVFEKQRLQHAVRLGDTTEVCKNPCPGCGYWGLMWDTAAQRARCTNRRCTTPEGLSTSWTLTRLAAQTIERTEIWRRNAT
ncbi:MULTISPECIES: hypothetical protein [Streptomyces rochei group]|uniref:hypothetical protein n=1 Tax=Streptomyces rochei group TaxID=2867164 RepID=UPI0018746878|nr:hypothetical protein [Streptomyces vinaceusdrappus]GHC37051.1 hypothetical protein GCM10010308_64490 [Streptomyces vinaceusdrappus]